MLKIALTHDVDRIKKTYQYISHLFSGIKRKDYKYALYQIVSFIERDTYWNFPQIIEIEEKYKVKSTFFFLHETIKFNFLSPSNWKLSLGRYSVKEDKVVKIIEFLDRNGWEVGLHGSFESYNNKELLEKEKECLEKILGHEIIGVRQHYLNLTDLTWKIQGELGFKYDSSWGFGNRVGFKDNRIKYFNPNNDDFVVFPLVIMDNPFVSEKKRWEIFDRIVSQTIQNDSILVIDWHSNNMHKKEFPNYSDYYEEIIKKCKNLNAEFDTLGNYYKKNSVAHQNSNK